MAKKKRKKLPKRLRGNIIYDVKSDRFRDRFTGRYISNITGLLSSAARRQRDIATANGERERWKEDLRSRVAGKVKKRKRVKPTTPHRHERFEFDAESGDIDDYLDMLIYRNLEYMEEEVLY